MSAPPTGFSARLRAWAALAKRDVVVVALAAADRRTPLLARLIAIATAAYALSPIDLIPDFIPVLGLLDDMILVPAGLALVIRLLPPPLLAEFREKAATIGRLPKSRAGAVAVIALWAVIAAVAGVLLWSRLAPRLRR